MTRAQPSTTTETERKYESPAGRPLPPLTGLPGVASVEGPHLQRLRATYFDTADLRLARRGVTLRRRTGGDDAGWHLKLPVDSDSRTEIREPMTRTSDVPAGLVEKVLVYTRQSPLLPVAQINTSRRKQRLLDGAGAVLAELAADSVAARTLDALGEPASSQSWREVEVELGTADRMLLEAADDLLTSRGFGRSAVGSKLANLLGSRLPDRALDQQGRRSKRARRASGDVVLSYIRTQVQALLACDPKVRADEYDAVHQMRVATRRLRSALQEFGSLLDPAAVASLIDELRWLATALGEVRDVEVLRQRLLDQVQALPPELVVGPVRERISTDLGSEYDSARSRLLDVMAGERYFALLDRLDELTGSPPFTTEAARPAADLLPNHLRRSWRRLARRAARVYNKANATRHLAGDDGTGEVAALHDMRKAAKRTRYVVEASLSTAPARLRRLTRRLTRLQDVLGTHQDSVVTREVIQRLAAGARGAGEDTFTYGVLYHAELDRARRAVDELGPVWSVTADKIARRLG